jgi:hypothetical protein
MGMVLIQVIWATRRRLKLPRPAIAALMQTFHQLVQALLNLDLDDGRLKTPA